MIYGSWVCGGEGVVRICAKLWKFCWRNQLGEGGSFDSLIISFIGWYVARCFFHDFCALLGRNPPWLVVLGVRVRGGEGCT